MAKFIKVTDRYDNVLYVNMDLIESIVPSDEKFFKTKLWGIGDSNYCVKESAEEVMKLLEE